MVQGPPFGLEKIYDDGPGGHLPLHLGDMLRQWYGVVRKPAVVGSPAKSSLKMSLMPTDGPWKSTGQMLRLNIATTSTHDNIYQRAEPRSIQDAIALGLFYERRNGPGASGTRISQDEAVLFADLLTKLIRYSPQERLLASESLRNSWLSWHGPCST